MSRYKHFSMVLVLSSLILGGVGFLSLLGAGQAVQKPVDPGIRFVDMHKAMVNTKFFDERLETIKQYLAKRRDEIKVLTETFTEKRKEFTELSEVKSGTKLVEKLALELAQMKTTLEFMSNATKARAKRNEKELEQAVYEMVRRTVAAYAVKEGLMGVMVIDEERAKNLEKTESQAKLSLVMEANTLRNVLWHNPEWDITDQIIELLNK